MFYRVKKSFLKEGCNNTEEAYGMRYLAQKGEQSPLCLYGFPFIGPR